MGLRTDVAGRLDLPGLGDILGDLGSAGQNLAAVELPLSGDDLAAPVEDAGGIDASAVLGAATSVATELGGVLDRLGGPGQALAPVERALEAVERVASADLPGTVEALVERLEGSFDPRGAGGFTAALLQQVEELGAAPEGRTLGAVLGALVETLGAGPTLGDAPFVDLPRAFHDLVRMLGALMALESMLGEGERLADILASRLDAESVGEQLDAIRAAVGPSADELRERIGLLDPADSPAVAAVEEDLRALAGTIHASSRALAQDMGFGEATLVYLNVPGLRARAGEAAGVLREARLDVAQRVATWLRDLLAPILGAELPGMPSRTLSDLLDLLREHVDGLADDIRDADLSVLTGPVDEGLGAVTDVTSELHDAVTAARDALVDALAAVEEAVTAVPLEQVVRAIRSVMEEVEAVMEVVSGVVGDAQAALETTATTVTDVLAGVESALDSFRDAAQALFDELGDALEALGLDQAVGAVTGQVEALAAALGSVELAPYFDQAVTAVDGAADVLDAVPLDLLPDDMEDDLAEAVRPIRETDLAAFVTEVQGIVGIGPDGRFTFRPDIEAAVSEVQDTYDAVIQEIEDFDLPGRVAELDGALDAFAQEVRAVDLNVALEPLEDALDTLRGAVDAADPAAALEPVQRAFDRALETVDSFHPDALLEPLDRRVDEAREGLMDATRLREWRDRIDTAASRAREIIGMVDPEVLRPFLVRAFDELRLLLEQVPDLRLDGSLGALVGSFAAGSGLRIRPAAWEAVGPWLRGEVSGTRALELRTSSIRQAVGRTRNAVATVDLAALRPAMTSGMEGLAQSVASVPDAAVRGRLSAVVEAVDPREALRRLETNRLRYLAALDAAGADLEALARTGFSEADDAAGRLRSALGPVGALADALEGLMAPAGLDLSRGFRGMLDDLLGEVDGDELADLLLPVAEAVRSRMEELLDLVAIPLSEAMDDLVAVVEAVDLSPLRDALAEAHGRVRSRLESLSPQALLGDTLEAWNTLRDTLQTFDPLESVRAVLEALRETLARVVEKLDVDRLLERPLEVYDRLLASLGTLDLEAVLTPVLDRLDALATQLDDGLDRTVDSFGRLQSSLPAA